MATYTSTSCQFTADGAVRFPDSCLLIPQAAQRRLERTSTGSFFVLKSLDDFLACRDCINDFPPLRFGGGSLMDDNSAAQDVVMKETIMNTTVPVKNDFLNMISPPDLLNNI
jgi:hypothetical protein